MDEPLKARRETQPAASTAEPSPTQAQAMAQLESILRMEQLRERPERSPDYETENQALASLVRALADSPRTILQILAEKVVEVLRAGSAGLNLLTKDGKRFYWAAIAGLWSPHLGGGTPRDFGPCGDVLDRNIPLMFTHWERRYPYLVAATPLAEGLARLGMAEAGLELWDTALPNLRESLEVYIGLGDRDSDRQELQRLDRCAHPSWPLPASSRDSSSRPRIP
jgi:hypothetical protein